MLPAKDKPPRAVAVVVVVVAAAIGLVAAACGPEPLADGYKDGETVTCTSCHGRGDDPAPPNALDGSEDTRDPGVGAHRQHLHDNVIRGAVACEECHKVPKHIGDEGHVDPLPAEVTFGPLASKDGADNDTLDTHGPFAPAWTPETLTCATYCHGATLTGGKATNPVWTRVDGSQAQCDSCHGAPPPAPHPQSSRCVTCHADTVDEQGRIRLDLGKHINGVVDSRGTACNSCHGSAGDPSGAPPQDLAGNSATTARGVGAHQAHLSSDGHLAVECSACHVVPEAFGDPGHADDNDARAEVTFSGLAVHDGRTPSYDSVDVGCKNTYCHGGAEPKWTVVDGTYSQCDACHGYPPPAPHPARTDCAQCHGMVVAADNTFVAPQLHVDGIVEDSGTSCDSCHGGDGNPAPPKDTLGNTVTTARGVGAHRTHLAASTTHAAIACSECHVVPENLDDPGHVDTDLPAEVTFGALAAARGAQPAWDGSGCSDVACHGGGHVGAPAGAFGAGATMGGTNHAPSWTTVNGTQAACGTCHGLPPPAPHPARTDCNACHGDVIAADGTFVDGSKHVDGKVDVSCNACHGDADSPAPPQDLNGDVDTAFTGVGAHRSHIFGNELHAPIACSECHRVPANVDNPGHRDTPLPAELDFGPLANAENVESSFNGVTCTTYCHGGDGLTGRGGSLHNPSWTIVDGTQAACGTCHGVPPPAPHPDVAPTSCGGCHPFIGTRPLNPALHINGVLERP